MVVPKAYEVHLYLSEVQLVLECHFQLIEKEVNDWAYFWSSYIIQLIEEVEFVFWRKSLKCVLVRSELNMRITGQHITLSL